MLKEPVQRYLCAAFGDDTGNHFYSMLILLCFTERVSGKSRAPFPLEPCFLLHPFHTVRSSVIRMMMLYHTSACSESCGEQMSVHSWWAFDDFHRHMQLMCGELSSYMSSSEKSALLDTNRHWRDGNGEVVSAQKEALLPVVFAHQSRQVCEVCC